MNENTGRSVMSPAGLGSRSVEATVIVESAASGKQGPTTTNLFGAHSEAPKEDAPTFAGRGESSSSESWRSAAHLVAPPPPSAVQSPWSAAPPKPLGTIRLQPDGRCGCRMCLLDAKLDELRRDEALAAIVYDLGVEALRAQTLTKVAPFLAAFEVAS